MDRFLTNFTKQKRTKGFTLIELIVVIAVIAILVLLATPKFLDYTIDAREAKIKHDTRVISDKVEEYMIGNDDKLPDGLTEIDPQTPLDEGRVYDEKGPVETIEPGPYYDITDSEILDNVTTKNTGKFIVNENGKIYYIHNKTLGGGNSGLTDEPPVEEEGAAVPKTEAEIDALIAEGWIPVSSPMNIEALSNAYPGYYWPVEPDEWESAVAGDPWLKHLLFGEGTKWEGVYYIPENPKFIQVRDLDLTRDGIDDYYEGTEFEGITLSSYGAAMQGVTYDGNYNKVYTGEGSTTEANAYFLEVTNWTFKNIIFEGFDERFSERNWWSNESTMDVVWVDYATDTHFENIWMNNINAVEMSAFLVGSSFGDGGITINNAHFTGSINGSIVLATIAYNVDLIENSTVNAIIESETDVGGIVGIAKTVKNSQFDGSINTTGDVGGIVCKAETIENSQFDGSITTTGNAGGIAHDADMIKNSHFDGSLIATRRAGGLVSSGGLIVDSSAKGQVNGGLEVGGLAASARLIAGSSFNGSVVQNDTGYDRVVGGLVGSIGQNVSWDSNDYPYAVYPEYPMYAAILNSSASGNVHGYRYVGGLAGSISYSIYSDPPRRTLPVEAVIGSSSDMSISSVLQNSEARKIVSLHWSTGTYHLDPDCPYHEDIGFTPDEDTGCDDGIYVRIIDEEDNPPIY